MALAWVMVTPAAADTAARRGKVAEVRSVERRPVRTVPDSDELVVLARVVGSSPSAGCGFLKVATVEHHQIVKVESGHYRGEDLYVAVVCHEFYAQVRSEGGATTPRVPGQVFRLRLERGEPRGEMVSDAYRGVSTVRYRLVGTPLWVPGGM